MKKRYVIIPCIIIVLLVLLIAAALYFFYFSYDSTSKALIVAKQKCELIKRLCHSKTPILNPLPLENSSSITAGNSVVTGVLPHMVSVIGDRFTDGLASLGVPGYKKAYVDTPCGGTLISEYFVLTAASCVNRPHLRVKLGAVNVNNPQTGKWIDVAKTFVHENYDVSQIHTYPYDIALLQLKEKVPFGTVVKPICLSWDSRSINSSREDITASGWGLNENQLLRLGQNVSDPVQSQCSPVFGHYASNMICGASSNNHEAICVGDYGGPLQVPLKGEGICNHVYQQIGIISFSNAPCTENTNDTLLASYTKVDQHLHWIVSRVWPKELENA